MRLNKQVIENRINELCIAQVLPANHKVSVAWQIAALFIPIANFWAFYRIQKLWRYVICLFAPSLAFMVAIVVVFLYATKIYNAWVYMPAWQDFQLTAIILLVFGALNLVQFLAFSVYLMGRWSREHNRKFA